MRLIDGSYGEGGGQLLRTAVALSAITGEAVHITDIRAKRSNPGLAAQHLTAVRAVAELCDGEVEGLRIGSQDVVFRPGRIKGGAFRFDVGTAGSIPLVLQALLPAAIASGQPFRIHLIGGTDVRAAPPLDYLRLVLLPLLAKMGIDVRVEALRRGYYPRGGGVVETTVNPTMRPHPLELEALGPVSEIGGLAHVSNLPAHIAERMTRAAMEALSHCASIAIEQAVYGREAAIGAGGAIVLFARAEQTILGASATAERGIPAEQLGEQAGHALLEEIRSGATLDIHATDQVLIYLALCREPSAFLARALSSHARTTIWLLEQFLRVRFQITPAGKLIRIAATTRP
jgi:RNA 3'-phosphate cyclase